jgi:hypothetical protein
MFCVCRPLPKPTAGDGHSLRGRKRLERLQRQGLAVVNSCQSDAVSSGSSTVTPQHLSPVNFDSHGEWHNKVCEEYYSVLVCGPVWHLWVYNIHLHYLHALPRHVHFQT